MLTNPAHAVGLAERNITNVSTDFMDIINNPEVEVVFVCSSTDTHCDISMAAVNAGKHVFCEKPIDYDIEVKHETACSGGREGRQVPGWLQPPL